MAQSVFTGTVKDTSGAVMPGVTVEAASPALIEKVKSTITDENGQYRIVDLRPGTYTLTFTLPGFNTIDPRGHRAAVELHGDDQHRAERRHAAGVGHGLRRVAGRRRAENVKQQVLSREVLDAVPTAKTIQGLGQLVARRDAELAGRRRLARDAADLLRRSAAPAARRRWCWSTA